MRVPRVAATHLTIKYANIVQKRVSHKIEPFQNLRSAQGLLPARLESGQRRVTRRRRLANHYRKTYQNSQCLLQSGAAGGAQFEDATAVKT